MTLSTDSLPIQTRKFVSVHVCIACGNVTRREEKDGSADANGVFHCSICGHAGPLNDRIVGDDDARLTKVSSRQ